MTLRETVDRLEDLMEALRAKMVILEPDQPPCPDLLAAVAALETALEESDK